MIIMNFSKDDIQWAKEMVNILVDYDLIENLVVKPRRGEMRDNLKQWAKDNYSTLEALNLTVQNGVSRACFYDGEHNCVIKVDFQNNGHIIGGCLEETILYNQAVKNKVEKFFAPISPLCTYDHCTFYIQEKAYADSDEFYDDLTDSLFETLKDNIPDNFTTEEDYKEYLWDLLDELEPEELASTIVTGTTEQKHKLVDFIKDNKINDLHGGNWGLNRNKEYIMIDYAGCHKESENYMLDKLEILEQLWKDTLDIELSYDDFIELNRNHIINSIGKI